MILQMFDTGNKEIEYNQLYAVDEDLNRWPLCIVWTPLPWLSVLCPALGHAGIGDINGRIHDFSKSNSINIDNF